LLGDGDALLPRGGIAFAINSGGVNQPMAVFNVEKEPGHSQAPVRKIRRRSIGSFSKGLECLRATTPSKPYHFFLAFFAFFFFFGSIFLTAFLAFFAADLTALTTRFVTVVFFAFLAIPCSF
jgi:hypothetical protein